jgi:hypothetical protein
MTRQEKLAAAITLIVGPSVGTVYVLFRLGARLYAEGAFYTGILKTVRLDENLEFRIIEIMLLLTMFSVSAGFTLILRSRMRDELPVLGLVEAKDKTLGRFPAPACWEVRYKYSFNGQSYAGHMLGTDLLDDERSDAVMSRYEVGKETTVMVDPNRPDRSLLPDFPLDSGKSMNYWIIGFFGLLSGALAILVITLLLKN